MSADGKIALVTGGGSGIGRAVAHALADDGWSVVVAGRKLERLGEAAAGRPQIVPLACDVASEADVESLFEQTKARFTRLDMLFNNAGTGTPPTPLEDLSLGAWRRVVDVNLTGAFLCARAAIRLMKAQDPKGGRIINNGSVSAQAPRPNMVAYTATKHAITGLTRQIALDGRAHDIACGQIDIGNAATDMTAAMARGVAQADGRIAPEPAMDVADIARSVLAMASLPLSANVLFMTVMATKMPLVGRG